MIYEWALLILGLRVPTRIICVGTADPRTESTHPSICVGTADPRTESTHPYHMCGYR